MSQRLRTRFWIGNCPYGVLSLYTASNDYSLALALSREVAQNAACIGFSFFKNFLVPILSRATLMCFDLIAS